MSDNDKAHDAPFEQAQAFAKGFTADKPPLTDFQVEQIWLKGYYARNAVLAHAEAQHAEKMNGLRDLLEELLIWNLCKFHLLEQGLQIDWSKADMACAFCDRAYRIKQALAEHRTEDANGET